MAETRVHHADRVGGRDRIGGAARILRRSPPSAASDTTSPASRQTRTTSRRRWVATVPLFAFGALFVWLLVTVGAVDRGPRARTFGGDFALNLSSAAVVEHGGNPYDGGVLLSTETSFLQSQGIPTPADPGARALTWGGYPPLYFWLLQPFTHLQFRIVALVWIAILYAAMIVGILALLRFAGWTRPAVPALMFLLLPQSALEAYYANIGALVFGIVMVALFLQRRYPFAAGLLLSLAWVKPQLAMISILLIALFYTAQRGRLLAGVALGSLSLVALTVGMCGFESMRQFLHGLSAVSTISGEQPNLAPLAGLYSGWASPLLRQTLNAATLVTAACLTYCAVRRKKLKGESSMAEVGWLWLVWFLALPYAHFADEIMLAPAIVVLLGRDGSNLGAPIPTAALYVIFGSVFLFSAHPENVQLLSLPLLLLGALIYSFNAAQTPRLGHLNTSPFRRSRFRPLVPH